MVGSEYSPQVAGSWVVARIALIDFIVLKLIDGCSFASQCDFEGPCSEWTLQDSVARITNSSSQPELDSNAQGFSFLITLTSYVCTFIHACIHIHHNTSIHTYICTIYMHLHTPTYTHICTHIHSTHTYTHIHTHAIHLQAQTNLSHL